MAHHESDWGRREQDRDIDQPAGFHGKGYQQSGWEKREQELGEGLSEWEVSEHSGLSDQELSRLKNTTAQRVFWIVVGITILLLLIVVIVGANVFHFWRARTRDFAFPHLSTERLQSPGIFL